MEGASARRRGRPGPVLVVFLLAALAFGIAAAILAAPASGTTSGPSLFPVVNFATGVAITVGFFGAMFAIWLLVTFRRGAGTGVPQFYLTTFLLVAIVIALVLGIGSYISSASGYGSAPSGTNSTGSLGNTSHPGGGANVSVPPQPAWGPGWVTITVVAVIAVLVAVLGLPLLLRRQRIAGATAPDPDAARQAVQRALAALDARPGSAPRERIIALYAQLLDRVGPQIERLGSRTAREVELECRERWRMPADSARALTGLFEEARYSDHPMPESAVDRARDALHDALRAIDTGAPSA